MTEQRLATGLMHGIVGSPEPQIGLGQRGVQRLRGRYRNQTLLVGAAEEDGDPHYLLPAVSTCVIPGRDKVANPESIPTAWDYGFRACVDRRIPERHLSRNPDPLDFPV